MPLRVAPRVVPRGGSCRTRIRRLNTLVFAQTTLQFTVKFRCSPEALMTIQNPIIKYVSTQGIQDQMKINLLSLYCSAESCHCVITLAQNVSTTRPESQSKALRCIKSGSKSPPTPKSSPVSPFSRGETSIRGDPNDSSVLHAGKRALSSAGSLLGVASIFPPPPSRPLVVINGDLFVDRLFCFNPINLNCRTECRRARLRSTSRTRDASPHGGRSFPTKTTAEICFESIPLLSIRWRKRPTERLQKYLKGIKMYFCDSMTLLTDHKNIFITYRPITTTGYTTNAPQSPPKPVFTNTRLFLLFDIYYYMDIIKWNNCKQ
jgi:hypothetical protein